MSEEMEKKAEEIAKRHLACQCNYGGCACGIPLARYELRFDIARLVRSELSAAKDELEAERTARKGAESERDTLQASKRALQQSVVDAITKQVAAEQWLDLAVTIAEEIGLGANYCPRCGACGIDGCCDAPRCAYADDYRDDYKKLREYVEEQHIELVATKAALTDANDLFLAAAKQRDTLQAKLDLVMRYLQDVYDIPAIESLEKDFAALTPKKDTPTNG
jgi:hypothetical protein